MPSNRQEEHGKGFCREEFVLAKNELNSRVNVINLELLGRGVK